MKRHRLISPGSLARLLKEAAAAWKRQDYAASLEMLERAHRLDPANTTLLLDLGRAHGMRYAYAAAQRCFEQALRVAARPAEVLAQAGRRCQEFGSYAMARSYFERAAQTTGVGADGLVVLAELCERQHQLEAASDSLERALHAQPEYAPALLAKARLHRQAGRLPEAETLLRGILGRKPADAWTQARTWYELGTLLDRMGRYDDAMSAWLEAKALLRPAAAPHAATLLGIQARVKEMESTISAGVLERWQAAGPSLTTSRRLAVLCGHPRSGTTLLEQVLGSHPDIVSAEETHILHDEAYLPLARDFPPDAPVLEVLDSAPMSALRKSREDYFRCNELFLGQELGDRLLLDKNPALNVLIPAVARIFPEAKFLIALRDPRDVCLSCFMQPLALNPVSSAYLSLAGTVAQYASVMHFWRVLLPSLRNPWIEVRYEDLVDGLEPAARRVLAFLEVPWDERVLQFHEHARRKPVRSPTYAEVTQPVFRTALGRWRNYESHLEPHLEKLAPFLAAFGYA
jgi:tetratricopeptide (TPR) repeat protein